MLLLFVEKTSTTRWMLWLLVVVVVSGSVNCGKFRKHGNSTSASPHRGTRTRSGPISAVIAQEKDNEFLNKGKICIGTNGRMSVPSNRDHHYRNLKDRFTNCTYVDGNLELTWLQDENLDLSFLQYIREVTGYVLISHVDIRRIVLPRLQIIRGRTLFKINVRNEEFALIVTLSKMFTLELPALRDVLSGSIGLFNNYNLCHVKTINWNEIITDPRGKYVYVYNFTSPERECAPCHKNCEKGCWGEGEENCQKFSKENCSPQCYQGRCFGPKPRDCCHLFCAGGCTGPKQSDCIACRNFYDDGICTQECPPMQVYNTITYSWEPNPNGKYAYGATCVKNCPEHLLKDSGACVRTCPHSKKAVNGECVPCDGPCPKTCPGDTLIHSGNIENFKGCTVIEGFIHILENSFKGYQHIYPNYTFGERYSPMHPDRLEVFSTLKEITGFIDIQASHPDFKNLSYFRNLEVIGGRVLHDYFTSLYIVKTSLQSLELRSLKRLNSGTIAILENKQLCFAENIKWDKIRKSSEHRLMLMNNSDAKNCKERGLVCDEQCNRDGCWGPGPEQCLTCANFRLGNTCLQNCSVMPGLYRAENNECKRCHEQCGSSCHGPGPDNCTTCKHYKDGPFCVSMCPMNKYVENGECRLCHGSCVGGCTGPLNTLGPGGCVSCDKAIMNESAKDVLVCLHENETCPDGYFYEWVGPQEQDVLKHLSGKTICRKCHPRCKKCSGYGFHLSVCQECVNYKKGEQCEDECPTGHYPDNSSQVCLPCDSLCKECTGPDPENCLACANFKVFKDGNPLNNDSFICVEKCPPEYPQHILAHDNIDAHCSAESFEITSPMISRNSSMILIIIIVSTIIVIGLAGALFVIYYCKKVKVKQDALKWTLALTGLEDNEPLRPTNVAPNVAKLRIIKETEMRRGGILGYGAFGTVYKGVWLPEGESAKIPVAIKVLREDTGANTSKEFLDEAYIMASVDHPNLLQLLAVCMTSQMMLITQLMPLGCLLDFVRTNKDKIGSKPLLNWCTQIARGMAYLEEKRLVHRDLAARNVLVQTPACVKITDFGLAKLLDINEEEYKAAGGKMPIKWLALECIQHRIFTHKSDVWAFGVTVWELLTFGDKPYDNVPAREVPELLEKGERLPQPAVCSIDVYMIMIKCWMLDAESRPGFKELADDFYKMARDPGRYLAIPGDKFMRLQNTSSQNDQDSVRQMPSSVENSETQSEVDEYLQPKSRAPLQSFRLSSIESMSSPLPSKFSTAGSHMTSDGSCAPQNQHNWKQERLRYAQTHGLDPTTLKSVSNSECSSLPYFSGDSLKAKDEVGSDEYDAGRAQAQVGTLRLELPLDEDDYLMPSPQQGQMGTTYVDLIDSKNGSNTNVFHSYPDFCTNHVDNPEYLMGGDAPCHTLGIPTVSELVQASCSNRIENPNSCQLGAIPQRNFEDDSDHEYYNDFDRQQRELQPLKKKGETTV